MKSITEALVTDSEKPVKQVKNAIDKRIMSVFKMLFVLRYERNTPISITMSVKCIPLIAKM